MTAYEAIRQFQATLEARRSAWHLANYDEGEMMNEEVREARRAMETAVLNEKVAR